MHTEPLMKAQSGSESIGKRQDNLQQAMLIDNYAEGRAVSLGEVSRDDFITAFRPEYPAIRFANGAIPESAKVLCLFMGNRGYCMGFQPVFELPYASDSILARFLAAGNPEHTIVDEMRQRNISHDLLRTDLTSQWLHQLSDYHRKRITPLFAHADQPLFNGQGHVVLAVPTL